MFGFRRRKEIKKGVLKNVDIELISFLFDDVKPANGKGAVVKSEQGGHYKLIANSTKMKSDKQGRVYVTVAEPGVKDLQGDTWTENEIVKAMDNFAAKGMIGRNDINHNMYPISKDEAVLVENYILKQEDKEHYPDTKLKSWVQVYKFNTAGELWKKVEKGQFNGISIYGTADDYVDNDALLEELKSLRKAIEKTGDKESLKAIDDRISEIEKQSETTDIKEIVKAIKEMTVLLGKAINKSIQGEPGGKVEDKEIVINGEKITIKEYHKEILKSFATDGDPMQINLLGESNSTQFIDETLETVEDDTLKEITVTTMSKDNKIDVGLINDIILKNELDGEPTAQEISDAEITVNPGILKSTVKIPRTTVEQYREKYGEAAYLAYVLKKLGNKALLAIKRLLFKGDRSSSTAALKALDGVIKKATSDSKVVDINKTTYNTYSKRFAQALSEFSDEMLEKQDKFVIYVSLKDMIKIRSEAEKYQNSRNSRLVVDGKKAYFDGIEIKSRYITDDYIIIGVPTFIIIGVRTDAEVYRNFIPWYWYWYIRLRAGITYVDGFVKVFHLVSS